MKTFLLLLKLCSDPTCSAGEVFVMDEFISEIAQDAYDDCKTSRDSGAVELAQFTDTVTRRLECKTPEELKAMGLN